MEYIECVQDIVIGKRRMKGLEPFADGDFNTGKQAGRHPGLLVKSKKNPLFTFYFEREGQVSKQSFSKEIKNG
jgi:hypothetical protein